jgi:hypothetical protein
MGVWGEPKNKVRGILPGDLLNFIALSLCVFLGRTPLVWATGFLESSCPWAPWSTACHNPSGRRKFLLSTRGASSRHAA